MILRHTFPFFASILLAAQGAFAQAEIENVMPAQIEPSGPVTVGRDGNLYGACVWGPSPLEAGFIYQLSPSGKRSYAHIFPSGRINLGHSNKEGLSPSGLLAAGQDGSIYGASAFGGAYDCGTIFQISWNGKFSVLHHFRPSEGFIPGLGAQNLLLTKEGDFFGYRSGGIDTPAAIFRLSKDGSFSIFAMLSASIPNPVALIEGSDGYLYGTSQRSLVENGAVFRVNEDGSQTILLEGDDDHPEPIGIAESPNGDIVGSYGADGKSGIYRLSTEAEPSFCPISNFAGGVFAADGNFYVIQSSLGHPILKVEAEGQMSQVASLGEEIAQYCVVLGQSPDGRIWGYHRPTNTSRIWSIAIPGLERSNIPPMAREDSVPLKDVRRPKKAVSGDYTAEIDVLTNDADADGDSLSIAEFTQPQHGTLDLNESETGFRYSTAAPQADEFSYTISDGKGGTAKAVVKVLPKVNPSYEGTLVNAEDGSTLGFKVAITPGGRAAGRIVIDGKNHSFHGSLNKFGRMTVLVERRGQTSYLDLKTWPTGVIWKVEAQVDTAAGRYAGTALPKNYEEIPE